MNILKIKQKVFSDIINKINRRYLNVTYFFKILDFYTPYLLLSIIVSI